MGWETWDVDLFDGRVAREYGYTVAEIDRLTPEERHRIARWWATEAVTRDAEKYLAQFMQRQTQTMQTVARLKGEQE